MSSNFSIKYQREICRILSVSVSTHPHSIREILCEMLMLMEHRDIIVIVTISSAGIPGHYRNSYTLEVLEMNNFICLVYHGIYRGIHLLAFSHFSKEKLVIMTISVTASYRHICSLQPKKYKYGGWIFICSLLIIALKSPKKLSKCFFLFQKSNLS